MTNAIIIVNYNDYESTKNLVDNIKDYKSIDKIIIVDNCSSEEQKKLLKKIRNSKVKIIYNECNLGYSYAINIGSKYLIDEYGKCNIIISNSDIIINCEKDIKDLFKILSKKDVSIVAPVVNEHGVLNRGWKLSTAKQEILFNIPKFYSKFEKKYRYYSDDYYNSDLVDVDVVSGCFFLIQSSTLEKIGFLDENVFLYYEENIIAKKIKSINGKIVIANNVEVIHNHSVTIDKNIKQLKKYEILKRSQYYFNKVYNNASNRELKLLKFTVFLNKMLKIIFYKFRNIFFEVK